MRLAELKQFPELGIRHIRRLDNPFYGVWVETGMAGYGDAIIPIGHADMLAFGNYRKTCFLKRANKTIGR